MLQFILKMLVLFVGVLFVSTIIGLFINNPKRKKNAQNKESK